MMRRREFLTLLAGAKLAPMLVPRAVHAQETVRRIGVLMSTGEADPERQRLLKTFRDTLRTLGWVEGRNLAFIHRWAAGSNRLVQTFAKELVGLAPDLLVTQSVELVRALHEESRTIPILFGSASDPTEVGLVDSIAHPGGNITGFMSIAAATNVKYLEVLKELDPRITRALVLIDSKDPSNVGRARGIEAGGPALNVGVSRADVSGLAAIGRAIDAFAQQPNGGLIIVPNATTNTHYLAIIARAAQHRLPAVYPFRFFAQAGGLVGYGADLTDQYRRAAGYADRILKGEKAGDLPIQTPTKFELVINLKTAMALGLAIPPMLLARADEVIE